MDFLLGFAFFYGLWQFSKIKRHEEAGSCIQGNAEDHLNIIGMFLDGESGGFVFPYAVPVRTVMGHASELP